MTHSQAMSVRAFERHLLHRDTSSPTTDRKGENHEAEAGRMFAAYLRARRGRDGGGMGGRGSEVLAPAPLSNRLRPGIRAGKRAPGRQATVRLFDMPVTPVLETSTALVPFDPQWCPVCDSPCDKVESWTPALLRHGGYGATRHEVRWICSRLKDPKCRWGFTHQINECRP